MDKKITKNNRREIMGAKIIRQIHNLFSKNLAAKKHENILIFTDSFAKARHSPRLQKTTQLIADEGKKFANIIFHIYPSTGSHGAEPPLSLWETTFGKKIIDKFRKQKILKSLLNKTISEKQIKMAHRIVADRIHDPDRINAVIALSWFSTTHTNFRKLLTQSLGSRYASMPLFDAKMLTGPMTADVKKMADKTISIAKKLGGARMAEINTSDGTNLRFSLKGRTGASDTGVLVKDGSTSNLPCGEAYIAPVEGTAEGMLTARFSQTRKLAKPLIFEIEKGIIKNISGEKRARERLEQILDKFPKARVLAEFGIGTNEKAKRPDNILEAEKILGTIHIAFGDNSTFGGNNRVQFHEDFVIFKPTVKLHFRGRKPETLINRGKI